MFPASLALAIPLLAAAVQAQPLDHTRDVNRLLQARCLPCHGAAQQMSGLRLDRREDALRGGYSGAVIQPGRSAESKLIQMVSSGVGGRVMPPVGPRLTDAEITTLRDWIDQGANWPQSSSDATTAPAPIKSIHWAFQPLVRPAVPRASNPAWVRNPIDAFVAARLDAEKLHPSAEADRVTLLRRLSLDLTGLPPTLRELDECLAPGQTDAYESAVDRLLSSPHYGEKWARPWLDLARYADSDGYEQDGIRRHAWRYRDWVIQALNRNMPFDQFTIEQIAGDLLPGATLEQKAATGFHRNTLTSREGGIDVEQLRTEQVADRANTVGSVWLGLTFNCAACHDHKYDPITQKNHYQFYAFFNTAMEQNLDAPAADEMERYLETRPQYANKLEALKTKYKVDELQPRWEQQARAAGGNPDKSPAWTKVWDYLAVYMDGGQQIVQLSPEKRTAKQSHALLRTFLKSPGPLLSEEESKNLKFADAFKELNDLDDAYPGLGEVSTIAEGPVRRKTHIHIRGNFRDRGIEVQPGTPEFLPPLDSSLPPNRLSLAHWLVSRGNPLTARVTVNRIWQELFGRGLVETSENFGTQGERPSHPELLDWLAVEFMESGWNVKRLQKLIVESATYRQLSHRRTDLDSRDPANKLLARQSRYRLPAELVRDVTLAASGLLNPLVGGRSVRPPLAKGVMEIAYRAKWEDSQGADRYRRGLYTFFQRSVPYPQLMSFDAPDSLLTCSRRTRSIIPMQALTLLNDPVYFEAAQALAARVLREQPGTFDQRLDYAFRLCTSRLPKPVERARLAAYYAKKSDKQQPPAGQAAAWVGIASVLLNLDEFITRE
ncbi:MAG TPA: PSD1 and planctomycete cytochrome C domain-containing protein [Bryobacteraceae bacterium]|nr:PSD1 and planctomycete cytochrome C domain-containing protein [Bryobacteraceae bacterium]